MDFYWKIHIASTDYISVRKKCNNYDEKCAYWATLDKCTNDASFMLLHYPLAYYSCDKIEQFECFHVDDNKGNCQMGNMNLTFQGLKENSLLHEILSGKWTNIVQKYSSCPRLGPSQDHIIKTWQDDI